MMIVVFEVTMNDGHESAYFDLAERLRPELEQIDGFISVERFQSLSVDGKYLSLSTWRDEAAVRVWREQLNHRAAQRRGREEIFADFRIRVAAVARDYTMADRGGAESAPV